MLDRRTASIAAARRRYRGWWRVPEPPGRTISASTARSTIRENPDFHGRVTSSKAACEKDRKVKVYREQSGPDGLLASTRTDDDGRWEYLAGQLTGDFYAKIRRTDVGPQGHDHVCKGDRSNSVSVQAPPPP